MSPMTHAEYLRPLRCPECTGPNSTLQFVEIECPANAFDALWLVPPQLYLRYRCVRCGYEQLLQRT